MHSLQAKPPRSKTFQGTLRSRTGSHGKRNGNAGAPALSNDCWDGDVEQVQNKMCCGLCSKGVAINQPNENGASGRRGLSIGIA
jgi:hypothetical protein|eukprot:2894491-Prymnesium_polylepis.1